MSNVFPLPDGRMTLNKLLHLFKSHFLSIKLRVGAIKMYFWEPLASLKLSYNKDEASSIVTRADYILLKNAVIISHLYTFLANYLAAFAS